jgi:hypothetical protein
VGATYAALTDSGVEQYHAAIRALVTPYFASADARKNVLPDCGATPAGDAACVRKFVTAFGRRAWRRPLTDAEVTRYVDLAVLAGKTTGDPYQGLAHASVALLESPHFIYRVELGQPDPAAQGRFRFTGHEMASRLSYLLTGSTPDAELLDAADRGQLDSPEAIEAQARRLLRAPAARAGLAVYAREFLNLDDFLAKSASDPRYTEGLRRAMGEEVIHLFQAQLAPGSDALDILDSRKSFVNAELAAFYGLPGVSAGAGVEATLPDQSPRGGLLGTGAFLAMTSLSKTEEKSTSPTARGLMVNEAILCRDIPPPPPGVKDPSAIDASKLTKRELLERHRSDPGCAACHALFDPLGYAFENFDWIGAERQLDNGRPVDTTGVFEGHAFKNARELLTYVKSMPDAQTCFVRNLFRYGSGHLETGADEETIKSWNQEFGRTGRDLTQFLPFLARSDGFRFVSAVPTGVPTTGQPEPGPGPGPGTGTPPPAPPGPVATTGAAWGRTELCAQYCQCMTGGKCSSPADCMNACRTSAGNWDLPCRLEKCISANRDYKDQVSGSCAGAVGTQACFDRDKL